MSLFDAPTDDEYDKEYGPVLGPNREVLRTSVSALQTLDPNTYGGCHRKWWLDKVLGKREPETRAHQIGKTELHEPIEQYYKTGEERFSPLVLQGKHLLYPHGSPLLVEWEIARPLGSKPDAPIDLSIAPLRVDGIPLVGRIDLTHAMGWYIDSNGEKKLDPPGTGEVNDWKSTGKREYAKKGPQLLTETIQMPGYGQWLLGQRPDLDYARLSHSYYCKDPKDRTAWKATALVPRDAIYKRWEYVEGLGRVMRDVARATNLEHVEGNRKSCDSYGRKGCPHKQSNGGTCAFGDFNSLSRIFGEKGAARRFLDNDETTAPDDSTEPLELIPVMGLLKNANPGAAALNLPGTPANVQAQNTPAHVGVNISMPAPSGQQAAAIDMIAALAAEQPKPAPQRNTVAISPEMIAAFDIIDSAGLGIPQLTGQAADSRAAYYVAKGKAEQWDGKAWPGSGRLNGLVIHTTDNEVLALAANVKTVLDKQAAAAAQTPAPSGIVSPETPASTPALAADPIPTAAPAGTATVVAAPIVPNVTTTVSSELPPSAPNHVAMVPVAAGTTPAPAEQPKTETPAKPEPKKRGPKPGSKRTPKAEGTDTDDAQPFELYIDCVPSMPYELADQYVSMLNAKLCQLLKVTEIPDIRSAPKSIEVLAFGAYKGTYEALAREAVADGHIPAARYVVFTKGNELAQLFANALIAARHKSPSGEYDGDPVLDGYTRGVA